jgi:1,2-phenylacetyl-CoA epoxidase catalytic subunit
MPDYRWGIFLEPKEAGRTIGFGDHLGEPAWQEVPGELRNMLRRIIVTQGDTEPASVEQQRMLGHSAPSLYDMRNLFQVNVEEGRHLLAMVYLLQSYFGRDGREEAEGLLERRSGDPDRPRILGAFNQPIENWLDFYMFTMFTDRDGKYQLAALQESGFDPLSRTCKFMLSEEAHHMFVGETGVDRMVARSSELTKLDANADARAQGGIDLATIQKYINLWFSLSLDLFGGEISSNAADFFAAHAILGRLLKVLQEVGLGYIELGQSATTLSGGEAQRVKLAKELSRRGTGRTLYILDEPTTGLHFEDTHKLLDVLNKLVDQGNTVVVIEHNLDVIKSADYVIDLGPEGGEAGGRIVAEGTPEEVASVQGSATGEVLARVVGPQRANEPGAAAGRHNPAP